MIVVPFFTAKQDRGPIVLVLILEKENLERMKSADPFDMQLRKYDNSFPMLGRQAGRWAARPISELDIVIAYEEDQETIQRFARTNDIEGLIAWLERGRKIKPGDLADPVSLKKESDGQ
jgi:hypothetical protein